MASQDVVDKISTISTSIGSLDDQYCCWSIGGNSVSNSTLLLKIIKRKENIMAIQTYTVFCGDGRVLTGVHATSEYGAICRVFDWLNGRVDKQRMHAKEEA